MKNKFPFIALTLALIMTLLAGCSGGGSGSGGETAGTDSKAASGEASSNAGNSGSGKETIQFWHSIGGKNGEFLDAMIKRFNSSQDKIEVVGTFQGSYQETVTKLQQAVAAKTAPDVTMLERSNVQLFADAEVLEDLAPYMEKSGLSKDDFEEGLMGHSYFNDKLVSLPFNRSTPVMHINKSMLDEKGLSIPTTWDELKKTAEALVVKENGEVKRYGLTMPYDTWYPIAMITQAGGKFFNDEGTSVGYTTEASKTFKYLKELQNIGALYYPPSQDSGNITNQMFTSGKVGILFQSTGSISGLTQGAKFDYVTAFLPQDKQYATPTGGGNVAMMAASKHKDAAWEFMHWLMTSPEGAQQFVIDTGYLPFTKQMVDSDAIKQLWEKEPNRKVAFEQLQYAVDTNKSVQWPQVEQEFNKAIQAIMYDNKDVDATLNSYKEEVDRILKN
ncbi:ABC transporter substrate-binding protein [Paenibacillus sp. SSG-1]|uniref:ABC transporter substrate-binding protein n=1 Tax=Paenibacillus sp. SSG-1 TaxID=1443669 RepID=UPI000B9C79DD|nr:ABC transporter substrate-binding protein [Paenibacillus sp. SSG-1]OXL86076.1 ABC transporter substrate-binding protein [Paenibacillus sp. SSG-1]